jgi:hypothetical protein
VDAEAWERGMGEGVWGREGKGGFICIKLAVPSRNFQDKYRAASIYISKFCGCNISFTCCILV